MAVAGLIPVHLPARERQKIYIKRTESGQKEIEATERKETYRIWQEEWEVAETGRWTWRLIKEVKQWSTRKWFSRFPSNTGSDGSWRFWSVSP